MGLDFANLTFLDRWFHPWLTQYTKQTEEAVRVQLLRLNLPDVDRMLERTAVAEVHEQGQTWYSKNVRHILNTGAFLYQRAEWAPQGRVQVDPFIHATQQTKFFLTAVQHARRKGHPTMEDVNRIFNFSYGGLEGYLNDELTIVANYPLAMERAHQLKWCIVEDLADQLEYRRQDAVVQHAISREIFSGIDRYEPMVSKQNTLQLPTLPPQAEFYHQIPGH